MSDYEYELDFLCHAIADSLTLAPNKWLQLYSSLGSGVNKSSLPVESRHLVDEFKQTRIEMIERSK